MIEQLIAFVVRHWFLSLTFILLLGALVWIELRQYLHGVKKLSSQAVVQWMNRDQALVVDIRSISEFQKGHIQGAIQVPASSCVQDVERFRKKKVEMIVLVCQMGQVSPGISEQLKRVLPDQEICVLAGGMAAWQSEKLPLVSGKK